MSKLREYFPWLTPEEEVKLRYKLLARAAEDYEGAGMLREAAECWVDAGDEVRAAELYGRAGEWEQAGAMLLKAGKYEAAKGLYESWLAEIEDEDDILKRIKALLGQGACEVLANPLTRVVPDSYRQAKRLVEAEGHDVITNARCWAALGAYGALVGRYDLVHIGYELSLRGLSDAENEERLAIGQPYLAAAKQYDDRLLVKDVTERLAKWEVLGKEPAWKQWQRQIEQHPFGDGVQDVLHFTDDAQLAAWYELASIEENPAVDDYLRTLAPPDMVYIPAGAFLMGWTDEEVAEILAEGEANGEINDRWEREQIESARGQHEVWLRGYYMNRYPITNAQYAAFMEAGGYQNADYWREAEAEGWWRDGQYYGNSQPRYWTNERHNHPQQPVVGISWHEALAYCRWAGMDLPTEAQWEKAAGWDGTEKKMRRYPWGDEYDRSKVLPQSGNYPQVGQFCRGELNYYGLADMAGLEHWCRSKYQPYPYQADDGRELLEGRYRRVWRGFRDYSLSIMRCRSRDWGYPSVRRPQRWLSSRLPHA